MTVAGALCLRATRRRRPYCFGCHDSMELLFLLETVIYLSLHLRISLTSGTVRAAQGFSIWALALSCSIGTMARGDVTVPLCHVLLAAHSVYAPEFLFFGLPCVCNCWLLVGCHNAIASSPPVPAASCETVARVVGRVNLVIGLLWGQGYTHVT